MPPKKPAVRQDKIKGNTSCTGRDITPLQNYILNTELGRGYLANLLEQEMYLEEYRLQPILNECEFSFAGSDWFGVYLLDSGGNKYWLDGNGAKQPFVYYFKIIPNPEGGLMIDESTHRFTMPPELVGVKRCIINDKGKCGVETVASPPKAPKEAKAPSPPKEAPVRATREEKGKGPLLTPPSTASATLSEETRLLVESLNLSAPARSKEDLSAKPGREAMEKMDLNTLMNWVSVHMYPEDLLRCVRSGNLSKEDKEALDTLEGSIPSGSGGFSAEDLEAVRMASVLPPSEAFSMYKKITRGDIMADINKLKGTDRQSKIISLCNETGLGYLQRPYKGSVSIVGPDGERITDDEALTQCASVRAIQMRSKLQEGFTRARGRASIAKTLTPTFKTTSPTQVAKLKAIIENLVEIKNEGDFESLVAFAQGVHYDNIGISPDGKTLTESGRPLDDEEIDDIIDQMALSYIKQHNVAFGKRKRSTKVKSSKSGKKSKSVKIFTLAAKHCKGKSNYRKCMSKTLKKMHSSFGRKKSCKRAGKSLTRRKVINNFKCAVRKCKKTKSGYRICMSKTLKKIYRKSSFGDVKENIKKEIIGFKKKLNGILEASFSVSNIKKGVMSPKVFKNELINQITPLLKSHFIQFKENLNEVKKEITPILQKMIREKFDLGWGQLPFMMRNSPPFLAGKIVINKVLDEVSVLIINAVFSKLSFGKLKRKTVKVVKRKVVKRKVVKRKVVKRKVVKRKVVKRKKVITRLRKTVGGSKRISTTRKSPEESATLYSVGKIKKGNDGNLWVIKKTSNGVKRWFKK
jgi:hypothetical protein